MRIIANTSRPGFDQASNVPAQTTRAATPQSYLRSHQPHVLTDALKAQLAVTNRQRRERLYPRLEQTLAAMEQNSITHSHSEQRAISLQQLAAANKARRSNLRETDQTPPRPQ